MHIFKIEVNTLIIDNSRWIKKVTILSKQKVGNGLVRTFTDDSVSNEILKNTGVEKLYNRYKTLLNPSGINSAITFFNEMRNKGYYIITYHSAKINEHEENFIIKVMITDLEITPCYILNDFSTFEFDYHYYYDKDSQDKCKMRDGLRYPQYEYLNRNLI